MSSETMKINPQRAKQLLENLTYATQRISSLNPEKPVRLILVSKLKPASDILALHQNTTIPATHFGENYFQELSEKASILPRSIQWHFIGGLQSNKCKPLAESIPNLWCVSSVDSAKKADQLEKGRRALMEKDKSVKEKLRVMVQVNTSGEESKSGVEPKDTLDLCQHIKDECPHLRLSGLMTIGAIARSQATTAETENDDFICLRETAKRVVGEMAGVELELSMGMSGDFEGAIKQGSDEVRIGSSIFGERPAKKDAIVKDEVKGQKG